VTLKARTTDQSTLQHVYVVYHSAKNVVAPGEFTDQILVSDVSLTPNETTIASLPASQMVIGKTYYAIQETKSSDPNAKKYQGNTVKTMRNTLMGAFTYTQPAPCAMAPAAPVVPAAPVAPAAPAVPAVPAAPVAPSLALQARLQERTYDRQEPAIAAISNTGNEAKNLKQRMDILSDVQSLLKNKKLEKRRLPCKDSDECAHTECQQDNCQNDSCQKDTCAPSVALSQGREFKKSHPAPCDHDMSQYIRKDSIPCWKCNLDY
jgi:hypothetical protein